jgi:hypothetical protein
MYRKHLASIGLVTGLVAGAGAGVLTGGLGLAGAQTDTTEATDTTSASSDGASAGFAAHLADALAPLVADGTITQEQADAVVAALEAARPERGRHLGARIDLEVAAAAIGVSEDDLRAALLDGTSMADYATSQGVDPQAVIDALVAANQARLDEAVAAGEKTQEEADEAAANAVERITAAVNGEMPLGGRGFGARRGPGAV